MDIVGEGGIVRESDISEGTGEGGPSSVGRPVYVGDLGDSKLAPSELCWLVTTLSESS